jgi:predicted nucleic acid-binding protein
MKFVVDTNVLFTFFWRASSTRGLLLRQEFDFFSPELASEEIKEQKDEILRKTGISSEQFNEIWKELSVLVEFVPLEEYSDFFMKVSIAPDEDDIDFLALALKLDCPLWSNDKALKKQSLVEVFDTREFIYILSKNLP